MDTQTQPHIILDGKFYFSIFGDLHRSWCYVQIIQGKNKALVILAQPHYRDYIGTYIANAAEHVATQLVNLFGLDPNSTTFLNRSTPQIPKPVEEPTDPIITPFVAIEKRLFSPPNEEKYQEFRFQWSDTSGGREDIFGRYSATDFSAMSITPKQAASVLAELT